LKIFPEITNLSEENLDDYPIGFFEGKIHVVNNQDDLKKAVAYLSKCEFLGFDTETRPAFKKGLSYPLALLQLSDHENAFLFRVQKTGIPKELQKVLGSKKIKKIGAAIYDDINALKKFKGFDSTSFIDIQTIAKDLKIEHFGLKKLAPLVLGFKISKRQQLSNWENPELTTGQQRYAATDAWLCLELFKILRPYIND